MATIGLAVAGVPRLAWPCTPCVSTDARVMGDPADVPSNVLLEVRFPEEIDVTIDGVPATLTPAPLSWWPDAMSDYQPMQLDPIPPGGNSIVLDYELNGLLCFGQELPPLGFTVGPPDLEPPAPPANLTYDVHSYNVMQYPGACEPTADTNFWLHLDPLPGSHQGEVLRVAIVEDDAILEGRHYELDPGPAPLTVRIGAYGLADPTQVCLRVSAMDSAGNETGYAELCDPCHVRIDPPGPPDYLDPAPEPEWSREDLWPGGSCVGVDAPPEPMDPDPGGTSTGGGDDGELDTGDTGGDGEQTGGPSPDPQDGTGSGGTGLGGSGGTGPDHGTGSTSIDSNTGSSGTAVDGPAGCACRSSGRSDRSPSSGWALLVLLMHRRRRPA